MQFLEVQQDVSTFLTLTCQINIPTPNELKSDNSDFWLWEKLFNFITIQLSQICTEILTGSRFLELIQNAFAWKYTRSTFKLKICKHTPLIESSSYSSHPMHTHLTRQFFHANGNICECLWAELCDQVVRVQRQIDGTALVRVAMKFLFLA